MVKRKRIREGDVDLYEDLEDIKDSLANITNDLKSKARDMFSHSLENAKDKSSEIQEDVDDYITSRPYQTIGAALLVGIVMGFILRHKD